MLCINCGHVCPEGSRFCPMCGKPLTETPPEPVPGILLPPEKTDAEAPSPEETAAAPAAEEAPPAPVSEFPPLPPLPPKKGSPLPPILIMVGMILVGLVLFFATTGTAAPPDCSTEIPWLQMDENGLVTFVESEYSGDWVITIPDTLNGHTVTGLADSCFAYSHVVTVELPDTLETIGSGAFRGCQSLRGIFLPEGIRTIDTYAFAGCSSLEAICIPGTVTSIGSGAFQDSGKLRFVFYSGYYRGWTSLYPEYICPHTYIICVDGSYLQGTEAP